MTAAICSLFILFLEVQITINFLFYTVSFYCVFWYLCSFHGISFLWKIMLSEWLCSFVLLFCVTLHSISSHFQVSIAGILDIGIYSGRTLAWKAKILNSTAAPIWFWIRDKYVQQSSKAKVYMILLISILLAFFEMLQWSIKLFWLNRSRSCQSSSWNIKFTWNFKR